MSSGLKVEKIADKIRGMHQSGQPDRAALIEEFLNNETSHLGADERIAFGESLLNYFAPNYSEQKESSLNQLMALLFEPGPVKNLSSYNRSVVGFANSLNIVFDSLDELIDAINEMFSKESMSESIRTVVCSSISNEADEDILQEYLAQVKQALGVMDKAYRKASFAMIREFIDALAPNSIAEELGKGVKLGPFRKAEIFSLYEDRFQAVNKWLDSGMFYKALNKEFEKSCQEIYSEKKEF